VKSDWRACLDVDMLNALMAILLKGHPLNNAMHRELLNSGGLAGREHDDQLFLSWC